MIDEAAGTVTLAVTFVGLPEKVSLTHGPTLLRDAGIVTITQVFEYTGDPEEPFGDLISQSLSGLHGPHPDLLSDFEAFCNVVEPYLVDPERTNSVAIRIYRGKRVLKTIWTPLRDSNPFHLSQVVWRTPGKVRGRLRFSVRSLDAAGNKSRRSWASLRVR